MNVYLLKSKEVNQETYENILNFFKQFPGPLNFKSTEEVPFVDKTYVTTGEDNTKYQALNYIPDTTIRTWDGIFQTCKEYRKKFLLGDNEFVILLTDQPNEYNWFLGGDEYQNGFIHTADWHFFFPNSDNRFPIVYQIISLLLKQMLVNNFNELSFILHKAPKGCLMDFCQNKKEIVHKMRSADICTSCLEKIERKNIPRNIVIQMFNIMDGVRDNILFKKKYLLVQQPSRLAIEGRMKKMFLTDFGNLEIRLTPLEKTIYLLFLNHPEGLEMNRLTEYEKEVYDIYSALSNKNSNDGIKSSVMKLIDPLGNSASEKIAKIKRKFIDAIGERMAKPYFIQGPNGGLKKIDLNRKLISFTD